MKKYKQQKAEQSEIDFFKLCEQRKINCVKLDDSANELQRQTFLTDQKGKCPDFLCEIKDKSIFVEIKTQTHFPNAKREKFIEEYNDASRRAGNSIHSSGSFDYTTELEGFFKGILKDTNEKFKNIKEEYKYPRIMFLNGVFRIELIARTSFLGATEEGVFYKTGSNVSALVFENKEVKCFDYIANPKAKTEIYLSKKIFDLFF